MVVFDTKMFFFLCEISIRDSRTGKGFTVLYCTYLKWNPRGGLQTVAYSWVPFSTLNPCTSKNGKKRARNLFKKMKCSQACSTQQNPLMPPLTLVISTFDCRILNWKPTAVFLNRTRHHSHDTWHVFTVRRVWSSGFCEKLLKIASKRAKNDPF